MGLEIRSLEIRTAVAADADAACTVLRRSISECCVQDHKNDPAILDAWLGNKTPQMVANWFSSPTNFSLVAVSEGAVVGVALLTGAGKLALCYLLPEARGQGVGKALLAELIGRCERLGIRQMLAVIGDAENRGSISVHKSCGFEHTGTFAAAGWKFERWLDVVMMQRRLGTGADAAPVEREDLR